MDLFMDKLSQKSTAEEIIRANIAADVEELNKWKQQAADYGECLAQMHKLVDEGLTKLACSQVESVAIVDLVEENGDRIQKLQEDMESFRQFLRQLEERLGSMDASVNGRMEAISRVLEEKPEVLPSAEFLERLDVLEENVHKECVKVYRNVQAVLVEESGKQGADLDSTKSHVKRVKKKVTAAMVFSIMAMVFALAGLTVQILNLMHILVF